MIIHIIFLIVLIIAVGAMISAIITIHNYADMLKNPIGYNLAYFKVPYCSYINDNGQQVMINAINRSF
jgi:hypothetical protein